MGESSRRDSLGPERALTVARAALRRWGFEPERTAPGCLRLRNCPFHPLAAGATETSLRQRMTPLT
jgi:hypothetical protein